MNLNFKFLELCLGTYECVATKDYCRDSKEPNTPGILFAIDVSYPMIKEGVVQLICKHMKSMIADLPRDPHCDKVCCNKIQWGSEYRTSKFWTSKYRIQ